MKLRIKGNTLRVRVSRSEVGRLLAADLLEETIYFTPEPTAKFTYALQQDQSLSRPAVRYTQNRVAILIPTHKMISWGTSDQVGIAGHCTVGDGVILTAQSAVSHDVPPGKMISGSPGFDNRIWLRAVAIFQRLPEVIKRLDRVEKKLASPAVAETAPDQNGTHE